MTIEPGPPSVDPDRFQGDDGPYPGHWRDEAAPTAWGSEPALLAGEFRAVLGAALEQLPDRQRSVVSCATYTVSTRMRCARC